jgi:hypothetical protein
MAARSLRHRTKTSLTTMVSVALPARIYTEVALTYSSLAPDRSFIVSDDYSDGGIVLTESTPSPHERPFSSGSNSSSNNLATPTRYIGLESSETYYKACVSIGIQGKLTTTAKPHAPWILCVNYNQSKMVELNLSQTVHYEVTTAVQAFHVPSNDNRNRLMIQLLLVDSNGVILKILLDPELQPVAQSTNACGTLIRTPALLQDFQTKAASHDSQQNLMSMTPNALQTCQVVFVNASKLVLALNPYLVTILLPSQHSATATIHFWTLQAIRGKQSTRMSFLNAMTGAFGVASTLLDLPPCCAIAGTTTKNNSSNNKNDTTTNLVSLHSNGLLYLWTLASSDTSPSQVAQLHMGTALPRVDEWTSDQPVRPLCLKRLRDKLVLGIALQTSALQTSLIVGSAAYSAASSSRVAELEMQPVSLVSKGVVLDMEFVKADDDDDDNNDLSNATKCQLMVVFSGAEQEQRGKTLVCVYPPAAESALFGLRNGIIAAEPVIQPSEFFLYSSNSTGFDSNVVAMVATSENTLAAAIHAVDKQNMQRLFRNCNFDQIPSRPVLVQALQQCVPGYRVPEQCSLELETLLAIQELRKRQLQSKRFANTPSRQTYNTPKKSGVLSIYEQLTPSTALVLEEPVVVDDADDQEADIEQQVKEHQQRWNQLFATIYEEQRLERLPCMLTSCGSELFLLRPGTASVVRQTKAWNLADSLKELDEGAMHLMRLIEADPVAREALLKHEQMVWNLVASGKFALGNSSGNALEDMIKGSFARLTAGHNTSIELERAVQKFKELPELDRVMALQNTSFLLRRTHLPGLNLLFTVDEEADAMDVDASQVPAEQLRFTAMNLSARCFESLRRLCLGRSLLLLHGCSNDDQSISLRMYVHMVGLLWTSCQSIPSPIMSRSRTLVAASLTSPPRKKSGTSSSIDTSLVLDALIQQLPFVQTPGQSLTASTIEICKQVLAACLQSMITTDDKLPELGIIANEAMNYSGIAYRLIAPFVRYSTGFDAAGDMNTRNRTLAECLLKESRLACSEDAIAMVQRAQLLLPFDTHNIAASRSRLELLCQNIISNPILAEELLDYVDAAIASMKGCESHNDSARDKFVLELVTARFNAAVVAHRWDDAVMACYEMRRCDRRQAIERLVRAMVESGDLARLIELCSSPSEVSERAYLETYAEKIDFATVAVETLSLVGSRDGYLLKATQEGPFTDYFGALFAIYISQDNWKQAAEVQNMIYENARNALSQEPPNVDHRTKRAREELIIKDMMLSAIACRQAIDQLACDDDKFIVSRTHDELSALSALNNSSPPRVRPRTDASGPSPTQKRRLRLFASDIRLRAHLTESLSTIYFDGGDYGDDSNNAVDFAKSTLAAGDQSPSTVGEVFSELLRLGYFHEALVLACAVDKILASQLTSHDNLGEMLELVVRGHLIPLVHVKQFAPKRPTLRQLHRALDLFGDQSLPPSVLIGDRSKVSTASGRSDIRTAASELMRRLTVQFSTSHTLLARRVATAYFELNPMAPLPQWLEELLTFGTDLTERHGMFAKYASNDAKGFAGDPSALLTWYTKLGMYEDACRVVIATLAGPDPMARRESAPSRLAQRGKTDYIPIEKIDLLFSLMDIGMRKNVFDDDRLVDVRASRDSLEKALIDYLELVKISVEGLPSAMAMQE